MNFKLAESNHYLHYRSLFYSSLQLPIQIYNLINSRM
uniref:Uncharacterized protein n=1 Tax=Anguilla anguilla TaxID=7936 RepID=A0A0E9VSM5_ANGAN